MAKIHSYDVHQENFSYSLRRQLKHILKLIHKKENKNILLLGRGGQFLLGNLTKQGYNAHWKEGADMPEKQMAILGQDERRFRRDPPADDSPALMEP